MSFYYLNAFEPPSKDQEKTENEQYYTNLPSYICLNKIANENYISIFFMKKKFESVCFFDLKIILISY